MVFQLIFIRKNYMTSKSNTLSAPNVHFCLRMTNTWGNVRFSVAEEEGRQTSEVKHTFKDFYSVAPCLASYKN